MGFLSNTITLRKTLGNKRARAACSISRELNVSADSIARRLLNDSRSLIDTRYQGRICARVRLVLKLKLLPKPSLKNPGGSEVPYTTEKLGLSTSRVPNSWPAVRQGLKNDSSYAIRILAIQHTVAYGTKHPASIFGVGLQIANGHLTVVSNIGSNESRFNDCCPYSKLSNFMVERFGVPFEGMLAGRVDTLVGCRQKPDHRADKSNSAVTLLPHDGENSLRHSQNTKEIGFEKLLRFLHARFFRRSN